MRKTREEYRKARLEDSVEALRLADIITNAEADELKRRIYGEEAEDERPLQTV